MSVHVSRTAVKRLIAWKDVGRLPHGLCETYTSCKVWCWLVPKSIYYWPRRQRTCYWKIDVWCCCFRPKWHVQFATHLSTKQMDLLLVGLLNFIMLQCQFLQIVRFVTNYTPCCWFMMLHYHMFLCCRCCYHHHHQRQHYYCVIYYLCILSTETA